ncbi:MAG: hypothetical protein KBD63_07295 [Bacteriovoracaceae bacterium]|nr:hypothetical protein [Bacteriovoracaceae bacterium]
MLAKDCTYCPLDYLPKEASFQTYAYDLLKKDRLSSLSSNIFSFDEMKNLPSPIQEKLFAELFYHIVSSSLPHNLYFNDLLNAQNELNLAEAHKLNVNLPTLYPQTLKDVQLNNVLILKTKLRQKYEEEKKLTYLQYDHLEQKETAFKTKVDKGLISIYDPIRGRASVTFLLDKKTNEYYEIDKVTLNYDDDTYLFHDEHINQNLLNWYVARIHIEG